jgi:hypothetical protein
MFSNLRSDNVSTGGKDGSHAAADQAKLWEEVLSLRISLQKSLDMAGKFPGPETASLLFEDKSVHTEVLALRKSLGGLLHQMNDSLSCQSPSPSTSKKRDRSTSTAISWDEIYQTQKKLRPNWEDVVNKWHARLHFGSEQIKSKMRVFNQTIWEQVQYVRHCHWIDFSLVLRRLHE